MNFQCSLLLMLVIQFLLVSVESLYAQNNNNAGGILINTEGLVVPNQQKINPGLTIKRQQEYLKQNLNSELKAESPLRKVSLVELSKTCQKLLDEKHEFPEEVKYLAGLTRIDYVFINEEQKDIVIAGPAGPFAPDANGIVINTVSKRPVLRLDDLLIALRAAADNLQSVGCSIDPVQANLAALQRELQNTTPIHPSAIQQRYAQLTQILGLHDVRVIGVKPDSNMSRVFVEADFRMKRISIGADPSLVKGLPSHLAMLEKGGNSMQRWWFVPSYDAIYASPERDAFEFTGQRLQLLSQDEMISANGQRSVASKQKLSTNKWAKLFTEKFPELCEKWTPFAEMQNAMDLVLAAYLIEKEGLPQKLGWNREVFLNPATIPCGSYAVPKHTQPIYNIKRSGRVFVGLITGGVTINPLELMQTTPEADGSNRRLNGLKHLHVKHEKSGFWWD